MTGLPSGTAYLVKPDEDCIYDRSYVSTIDITYNIDAVSSLYDRK